jgi:hypothetical protein
MAGAAIRVLVPSAAAAALLAQEFQFSELNVDGTLFTVVIAGATSAETVRRIRAWMDRSHIGPVLVTDGSSFEELLVDAATPRSRHAFRAARARRRSRTS